LSTCQHLGFWWVAILAATLTASPLQAQPAASLLIHVQSVSPKGGTLRLGLYDQAHYPDDNSTPVASADVPAQIGETVITLDNIPPGIYAIETYQDVNSNHKMDTTWLGIPLEPFGFSRDAKPHFAKPDFSQAKFEVVAGTNVQTLHLQNSISLIATK
jgi:uncharacterized protein (DUF2141 family)